MKETKKLDKVYSPKAGALSVTSHLEGSTSHMAKDSYVRTELHAQGLFWLTVAQPSRGSWIPNPNA